MSLDTAPCGCQIHADNEELCRYPALKAENKALKQEIEVLKAKLKENNGKANQHDPAASAG